MNVKRRTLIAALVALIVIIGAVSVSMFFSLSSVLGSLSSILMTQPASDSADDTVDDARDDVVDDVVQSTTRVAAQDAVTAPGTMNQTPGPVIGNTPVEQPENTDNKLLPWEYVDRYVSLWQAQDNNRYFSLWETILSCPDCLERLVDHVTQPDSDMKLTLEVSHLLLEAGKPQVERIITALLQPGANTETALLLARQVARNGNPDYLRTINRMIQTIASSGDTLFATGIVQTFESASKPAALIPMIELAVGRTGAGDDIRQTTISAVTGMLNRIQDTTVVAGELLALYYASEPDEQVAIWTILSGHSETMRVFANQAHHDGNTHLVDTAVTALIDSTHESAVDALLLLQQQLDYPQDYFVDKLSRLVSKPDNLRLLNRLADYLHKPDIPLQSKIIAAEGLLSASGSREARLMLEKMAESTSYEDAEIVSYINGRLQ